jgi:hypothetical protein
MSGPRPTSIYRLWIFLHECFHMDNNDPFRARHYDEFLAEQFALETIEAAGMEAHGSGFSPFFISGL